MHNFGDGLLLAATMAWKTGWSLVLGFALSAALQILVPADRLRDLLKDDRARSIGVATLAGAASSSCSYASASIMRTLLRKGAALAPSLAFLVASTNLVIELGAILWLLLGWRFMLAQWLGGLVMILLATIIVRMAVPARLVAEARAQGDHGGGHDHGAMMPEGKTFGERLRDPRALPMIGQAFVMEWRMLWKDLLAGFLIGGMLAVFVPATVWQGLFLAGAPPWLRVPADAAIGPIVAMLTFVCSIGNVPLAAMLWSGGASFGGVIAFLLADLIVLPLLDAYRRYFGWKMAAAIGGTLYIAMVGAALVIALGFSAFGLVPAAAPHANAMKPGFALDYSAWLNLVAILVAGALVLFARRRASIQHHHHH